MYWDSLMASGKLEYQLELVHDQKVLDFLQGEGCNEQLIRQEFQEDIANEIMSTPIYATTNEPDKMVWKATPNGIFSLASCYETIRDSRHKTLVNKSIWLKPTPPKVSFLCQICFVLSYLLI